MVKEPFGPDDLKQIEARGMDAPAVAAQLAMFKHGLPPARLIRACTVGDGIASLSQTAAEELSVEYFKKVPDLIAVKMVPASGAASRMFRSLVRIAERGKGPDPSFPANWADSNDPDERAFVEFIQNLPRFAFYDDLKAAMARAGERIGDALAAGRYGEILRYLLTADGLNSTSLPKGMVKFHRYPDRSRSAFEEHILEALGYTRGGGGLARMHLTIAREQEDRIKSHIEDLRIRYEKLGRPCEVTYSFQLPATDTIAVDMRNRPFRAENGRLVFRPGGHGALLENLNRLDADLVFIKNVDNVVPDHLKPETFLYRTALAGHLLHLQRDLHGVLKRLKEDPRDPGRQGRALEFSRDRLRLQHPDELAGESTQRKAAYLAERLDRPLRVCAMVKNQGEPGGGPFWTADRDGNPSPQIVEDPQIDKADLRQREIYGASTHFNPTDMVCGVRDHTGRGFDLQRFVDREAAFITTKSMAGRELKALERPGLWNGSMAGWISIFVEVPIRVFNPVKTVNALLRDAHQPPEAD